MHRPCSQNNIFFFFLQLISVLNYTTKLQAPPTTQPCKHKQDCRNLFLRGWRKLFCCCVVQVKPQLSTSLHLYSYLVHSLLLCSVYVFFFKCTYKLQIQLVLTLRCFLQVCSLCEQSHIKEACLPFSSWVLREIFQVQKG